MCSKVDSKYVNCLPECPKGFFYKLTEVQRFCCEPCFKGCLDGCTGNKSTIGKKGCNRCKYAVFDDDSKQYRCLEYDDGLVSSLDVCPRGYYAEDSKKKSITEFECKKCHKNCERCSSGGNDKDEDACICAAWADTTTEIRNNSIHYICIQNPDHRDTVIDDSSTTTKKSQKKTVPRTKKITTTRSPTTISTIILLTSSTDKTVIPRTKKIATTRSPTTISNNILLISSTDKTVVPRTKKIATTRSPTTISNNILIIPSTDKVNWIKNMDGFLFTIIIILVFFIFICTIYLLKMLLKRCIAKHYKDNTNLSGIQMTSDLSANESLLQPSPIFETELRIMAPVAKISSIAESPPNSSTIIDPSQTTQSNGNIFFPERSVSLETTFSNAPSINKLNIITKEQINILNKISEGQFGIVHQGVYKNQPVAIKKSKIQDPKAIKEAIDESTFMVRHSHPHIQKLLGVSLFDGFMIISKLRLGSLESFLRTNQDSLSIKNLLLYCTQIATAVEFLHSLNKIHGDLAARNVLVKSINHVEIGDFGLSRTLKRDQTGYKNSGKAAGRWLSPECLKTWIFDKPNDVWAFGITCWEVFTLGSKLPYEDQRLETNQEKRAHLERLENGYKLPQPTEVECLEEYAIMLRCWVYPAHGRANIQQVLQSFETLLHEV
uniref:receptor protein-tyrosine kinase n=1 Tax=Acrobeloides nanus TaxID=290746 RepID=A0A914BUL0_9BILA